MTAYDQLSARARELALLKSTSSLLHWDQETMMPSAANDWRADQLAWLSGRAHAMATAPEVGDWIEQARTDDTGADPLRAANLREWLHDYQRATRLPGEFVETCARTEARAHQAWVEARRASDFSLFAPLLETLVDQARRKAGYWGHSGSPYDALLDGYERGLTETTAASMFDDIRSWLAPLAAEGAEISRAKAAALPSGPWPVPGQQALNQRAATWIGFDFAHGRIDTTVHPFCTTIGPRDVRLTTRYDETDFTSSLFGVMHETGHGLYEQGLPEDRHHTPCGDAVSLGVHESQSRLWENHIGRGLSFCQLLSSWTAEAFPYAPPLNPDSLWRHLNRVRPSFIRVEADELTYDLHVALRFEIERRLIKQELEVAGVPAAWNQLFRELFGMDVPDDRHGCLQDIHWSMGGFGYFPTYTLGNVYAARLMAAFSRQNPGTPQPPGVLAWMREHIHQHGRRWLPGELVERAAPGTGMADYRAHLESIIHHWRAI